MGNGGRGELDFLRQHQSHDVPAGHSGHGPGGRDGVDHGELVQPGQGHRPGSHADLHESAVRRRVDGGVRPSPVLNDRYCHGGGAAKAALPLSRSSPQRRRGRGGYARRVRTQSKSSISAKATMSASSAMLTGCPMRHGFKSRAVTRSMAKVAMNRIVAFDCFLRIEAGWS